MIVSDLLDLKIVNKRFSPYPHVVLGKNNVSLELYLKDMTYEAHVYSTNSFTKSLNYVIRINMKTIEYIFRVDARTNELITYDIGCSVEPYWYEWFKI